VTRKQDSARGSISAEDLKRLLAEDRDPLKMIVEQTLQQVLEAEMDEALQASKGERTAGRLGYRAGHYNRMLVTRVGHIELRVPQDRQGRFRTEVFEALSAKRESAGGGDARDVRTRRVYAEGENHH
jgi:putative transposase